MEHFREALELNYPVEKSTCTLHCTHPFAVPVRLSTDPWKRETITWFNWEGKGATQFARSTVMQTLIFSPPYKKKQNKQTKITVTTNSQNIIWDFVHCQLWIVVSVYLCPFKQNLGISCYHSHGNLQENKEPNNKMLRW